ncbi:MAG: hypothetical protein ABUL72_06155, partial [Armatimonadota bacterium]
MDRLNEEGIPRDRLAWALTRADYVREARRHNRCLLCSRKNVNEAGLCEGCYSMLSSPELALAERWLGGALP